MKKPHTSPIEQYVITKVKEMRKAKGISQKELAFRLDLSIGFIGDIEGIKKSSKYNLDHINLLAKIFECSPQDFLPKEPLK